MKKTFLLVAFVAFSVACNNSGKKNHRVLPDSSGRLNDLAIVMDNDLWQGEIGGVLRDSLAAPVYGLPQQEPMFSINHIPPKAFSGFVRQNRTFLKVDKEQKPKFLISKDTFAKPQTAVFIAGPTKESITALIKENSDKIIRAFKDAEITEQQRRIQKSLKNDKKIEKKLGISIKFPTAYRYAKEKDHFFWIRKDIPNGSMEILLYEVPLSEIDKDTNVIGNIIAMRDSIGKANVPGVPEGSFLQTEEAFAPYLSTSKIDGKFAYETKGTWDVKGAFMAGPFINYAVRDEKNNRYVILEGFVFKPSARKRDHIFELESILKSARFIKK